MTAGSVMKTCFIELHDIKNVKIITYTRCCITFEDSRIKSAVLLFFPKAFLMGKGAEPCLDIGFTKYSLTLQRKCDKIFLSCFDNLVT